ncbi:hypothetical protein [Limosilactobacillus antri]|uniref:hypothetical protein n=1 Tax=Limosilactobacillus antri TaxID=227943 RepID=UPI001F58E12B|nr:hypothetical protein [Limosilactobacillus antri]
MRELYLTVGAPAIGKSTWIKEMGLEDYTVSSDEIRHIVSNYQAVIGKDGRGPIWKAILRTWICLISMYGLFTFIIQRLSLCTIY